MLVPFVAGLGLAGLAGAVLRPTGLLAERAAGYVASVAIASFYPVFAVGGDIGTLALHLVAFAAFSAVAMQGYLRAARWAAAGIAAHGAFDAVFVLVASPAPHWWPAFCAGFDFSLGAILWRSLPSGRAA